MKRGVRSLLLSILATVTGCERTPPAATYTVEQYRADAELRRATLERCAQDAGTLRDHPNCLNAQRAAVLEGRGGLRSSGPIGLPQDQK